MSCALLSLPYTPRRFSAKSVTLYNLVMAVQFTFDQAVRTIGVTPERLEKLIDEGKIRANRGVQTTFDREAVLEYMNKVGHDAVLERIERAKPASQRAKK